MYYDIWKNNLRYDDGLQISLRRIYECGYPKRCVVSSWCSMNHAFCLPSRAVWRYQGLCDVILVNTATDFDLGRFARSWSSEFVYVHACLCRIFHFFPLHLSISFCSILSSYELFSLLHVLWGILIRL